MTFTVTINAKKLFAFKVREDIRERNLSKSVFEGELGFVEDIFESVLNIAGNGAAALRVVVVDCENFRSIDGAINFEQRDVVGLSCEPTGSSFSCRGADEAGFGELGQDATDKAGTGINTRSNLRGRDVRTTLQAKPGHDVDRDRELGVNCHNCYVESNS